MWFILFIISIDIRIKHGVFHIPPAVQGGFFRLASWKMHWTFSGNCLHLHGLDEINMVSLPLALLILEPYHISPRLDCQGTFCCGNSWTASAIYLWSPLVVLKTACFFWLMVVYHGISWYIIVYHCQSWFAYFLAWLFDSVRWKRTEEQSLKLNCIVLLVTSPEPLRCIWPRGGLHQNCPTMLTNDPIHWFSRFNPCGFVPFIRCEI